MTLQAMAEAGADAADLGGDRRYGLDMRMARAAGADAIGSRGAITTPPSCVAAGADAVADHPADVVDLAEQLVEGAAA